MATFCDRSRLLPNGREKTVGGVAVRPEPQAAVAHQFGASRAIMTGGAGLAQVAPNLWVLAAMTAAFLALGAGLFRWE